MPSFVIYFGRYKSPSPSYSILTISDNFSAFDSKDGSFVTAQISPNGLPPFAILMSFTSLIALTPIRSTVAGIDNLSTFVSTKASSPIDISPLWNMISLRLRQFRNNLFPIDSTCDGISAFSIEAQLLKILLEDSEPICRIPWPKSIFARFSQQSKANGPISFNESGNFIAEMWLFENAFSHIYSVPSGISTVPSFPRGQRISDFPSLE